MVDITKNLWEIFKITGLLFLILTILKVFIEEWFIKPIKQRKLKEEINKATDELIEELKKEHCKDCKKNDKKPKKTTKKEDK